MADANMQYDWNSPYDMADVLLPSQSGYDKMAPVWLSGLSGLMEVTPLPVELVSFVVRKADQGIELNWKTASEQDSGHYEVERMEHSGDFRRISSVNGFGTTSIQQNYSFTDYAAPVGTLYYRLKQVDFDGTYSYSKVLAVQHVVSGKDEVFPNPTDGRSISLNAFGLAEGPAEVTVLNTMGEQVYAKWVDINVTGRLSVTLSASEPLVHGIYIVQVEAAGKLSRMKFLVR